MAEVVYQILDSKGNNVGKQHTYLSLESAKKGAYACKGYLTEGGKIVCLRLIPKSEIKLNIELKTVKAWDGSNHKVIKRIGFGEDKKEVLKNEVELIKFN